jgi:DNA-binding XRE family transcriptional regulator
MFSRDELAQKYSVKRETIIQWEKAGKLKPIRLSAHTVRFFQADVEAFETAQKAAQ